MTNYHVLRLFGDGVSRDELDAAVERSRATVEEMRGEGTSIAYLGSDVLDGSDGLAHGTMCKYDATSEEVVRKHSERAELPLSEVFVPGTPLAGIAPESGVAMKAA
ncbi:nickel-binding protein [Halobaculum marinum]|uniref:Nickel-binding protein n=1 Tax=Halobaculum marinum TaxID=3031996 RepID=A0ABD5X2N1_9EURY|nr:nickel-binding protein [Halobaculum sp. DT55]